MILIYRNLFDFCVSSATNADGNYPISNMDYSDFQGRTLLAPFKALGNASDITLILDEEETVNGFGIGNHNVDTLSIELYDILDTLLYTESYIYGDLVTAYSSNEIKTFTAVANVKKIIFKATGLVDPLSIGELTPGVVLTPPPAVFDDVNSPLAQTGTSDTTPEGALSGQDGITIEGQSFKFYDISQDYMDALKDAAKYSKLNKPFFLKRYEESSLAVWWCHYTNTVLDEKMGRGPVYTTGFGVQEVR